jgi:hypothetical protein
MVLQAVSSEPMPCRNEEGDKLIDRSDKEKFAQSLTNHHETNAVPLQHGRKYEHVEEA